MCKKVLVIGPPGSGKTYISSHLRSNNVNALDADNIKGLAAWYNSDRKKVTFPEDADQTFLDKHKFLWNRKILKNFLDKNKTMFVFGVSDNVFELLDLFDKVYFLKLDSEILNRRLLHKSRLNPMGKSKIQRKIIINRGLELERKAKDKKLTFIDASLSPGQIFEIIK